MPTRRLTPIQKRRLVGRLKRAWVRHDALKRAILLMERRLSDVELRRLGAAAG